MKCLFLGYDKKKTRLINFLNKKKISVTHSKKNITLSQVEKFDLIICFGYRKIIKKKILSKVKRPILNLHPSYLPFNRGAYPNYFSFYYNTKKGVTIHEIDKNLDTGPIIFQKEIKFNIKKNKELTFKQAYNILFRELEGIFIKNYKSLISYDYKIKKNEKSKGKSYKVKDLRKDLDKNFDISIFKYLNNLLTYQKVSSSLYSKLIWSINNDKDSRKYSQSKERFSFTEHSAWFKKTIKEKKESIYIARIDKKILGIIRHKKIKNKLFLSWALLKIFRGKNYGTRLVKEFVENNKFTFFAEVHKLNFKSIEICKKTGFKYFKKKNNFLIFKKR